MSFKRAKQASVTFKNTVFGFVREHKKDKSINTPAIIKYLILNYYLLEDRFGDHSKCTELQENGFIAYKNCPEGSHPSHCHYIDIYGCTDVGDADEGFVEYEWTIQISSKLKCFALGLTTMDGPKFRDDAFPEGIFGLFVVGPHRYKLLQGDQVDDHEHHLGEDSVHTFQMRLNVSTKELSFHNDGKVLLMIGESDGFKIDKFRLIVSLMDEGASAKLTGFKVKHL